MAALSPLLIDGSTLEGGGQILRNALSLSALLTKPVRITNVRANRKIQGLKPQHATGLKLVGNLCDANVEGVRGSREVLLEPRRTVSRGTYEADTETAGSTTLLLQTALPPLLFARNKDGSAAAGPSRLTLKGGTNATQAPQIDYTANIFIPFLQKYFGVDITVDVKKRGFYPLGGGIVSVDIPPLAPGKKLSSFTLTERGKITSIGGRSFIAGLPPSLTMAMTAGATRTLTTSPLFSIEKENIFIKTWRSRPAVSHGSGCGIVLWATTENGCVIAGSAIGLHHRKKETLRRLGSEAAEELIKNILLGGCVDEYLQDQIILFMALAEGRSTVVTGPLTLHTKTAIWTAEQLTTAKFTTEEDLETKTVTITCDGIGLST